MNKESIEKNIGLLLFFTGVVFSLMMTYSFFIVPQLTPDDFPMPEMNLENIANTVVMIALLIVQSVLGWFYYRRKLVSDVVFYVLSILTCFNGETSMFLSVVLIALRVWPKIMSNKVT